MASYYNEFDTGAAAWLRELIKRGLIADGEVDDRSILDVQPVDLRGFTQCHFFAGIGGWSYALRLAGWPDDRPVWTGSPPCQPFSAAGAGLGRDDERHLGPHFVSLVSACRPAVLFGEQVASSAVFGKAASGSRKAAARAPEWAWLDDLQDRLEAACYAVGASDIPAASVGAPHIRQRTFFGAIRLADADSWQRDGIAEQRRPERNRQDTGRAQGECKLKSRCDYDNPGAIDTPWRDSDWLFCRDGKWRPVESSALGMANGVPGELVRSGAFVPASSPLAQSSKNARRVMRLRGYGNAIVPQAAAEFIMAFSEAVAGRTVTYVGAA